MGRTNRILGGGTVQKRGNGMNRYEFKVTLAGYGETPEEAWQDAIEGFYDDPGSYDDDEWTVQENEGSEENVHPRVA